MYSSYDELLHHCRNRNQQSDQTEWVSAVFSFFDTVDPHVCFGIYECFSVVLKKYYNVYINVCNHAVVGLLTGNVYLFMYVFSNKGNGGKMVLMVKVPPFPQINK